MTRISRLMCLFFVLLAAACAPAAPAQTDQPATNTAPPALLPSPTAPAAAGIELSPCTLAMQKAQCGTLSVYEDRAAGSGRKIDIYVVVFPAKGEQPKADPLFYFAGGPGVAASSVAGNLAASMFSTINLERDLVFVDQRGVGKSHPLICPDMEAGEDGSQYIQRCLAGLDGDPTLYTTALAVDDVDEVRQALGYEQINLYGHSYGATAAQVYHSRHAEHVRSMTLDHGSLLDVAFLDAMPRGSQLALDAVFQRCAETKACVKAFPNLEGDFEAMRDQLNEPVPTGFAAGDGPTELKRADIDHIIHRLLLDARTAASLPDMIHRAAQGDFGGFIREAENGTGGVGGSPIIMQQMILCQEDWYVGTAEGMRELGAGSYLLETSLADLQTQAAGCQMAPGEDESVHHGPAKDADTPVLIFIGGADPQNPLENMAGAEEHWPNSRIAFEPNIGHVYEPTSCKNGLLREFIEAGSAEELDMSCLEDVFLPEFKVQ